MRGAAIRLDEGSSVLFDAGSRWRVPLYTCATAVKATIRTTSFLLNGTSGLSSLSVVSTRPKEYPTNESLPVWAVEESGRIASQFTPIWGLIGPDYEKYPNMSVVKKDSLYIPGYVGFETAQLGNFMSGNLPGSDFPPRALVSTYSDLEGSVSSSRTTYSGFANLPLYVRWQEYSRSPQSAARIPNLIWTDLAASAVLGTKSSLGGRAESFGSVPIAVHPLRNQIKYRWLFGIPAFIVLLLCIAIAVFAFVTFVFHRHNFTKLRKHLQQTAAGRILTGFVYPEGSNLATPPPAWNQTVGRNQIDLGGDSPLTTLLAQNQFYKGGVPVSSIRPETESLQPEK